MIRHDSTVLRRRVELQDLGSSETGLPMDNEQTLNVPEIWSKRVRQMLTSTTRSLPSSVMPALSNQFVRLTPNGGEIGLVTTSMSSSSGVPLELAKPTGFTIKEDPGLIETSMPIPCSEKTQSGLKVIQVSPSYCSTTSTVRSRQISSSESSIDGRLSVKRKDLITQPSGRELLSPPIDPPKLGTKTSLKKSSLPSCGVTPWSMKPPVVSPSVSSSSNKLKPIEVDVERPQAHRSPTPQLDEMPSLAKKPKRQPPPWRPHPLYSTFNARMYRHPDDQTPPDSPPDMDVDHFPDDDQLDEEDLKSKYILDEASESD